jgi:hypothetical protein
MELLDDCLSELAPRLRKLNGETSYYIRQIQKTVEVRLTKSGCCRDLSHGYSWTPESGRRFLRTQGHLHTTLAGDIRTKEQPPVTNGENAIIFTWLFGTLCNRR